MRLARNVMVVLAILAGVSAHGIEIFPPAPDSQTFIRVRLPGWCAAREPIVTVHDLTIDIALRTQPGLICVGPRVPYYLYADVGVLPGGVYTVRSVYSDYPLVEQTTLVVRDTRMVKVLPVGGPIAGGTIVEIVQAFRGIRPEFPFNRFYHVAFGDSPPLRAYFSPDGLWVEAPPHSPGTVDVTIYPEAPGGTAEHGEPEPQPLIVARAAFTYYDPSLPPDPFVFEPLLFPISYEGSGAFGSMWTTENVISVPRAGQQNLFEPLCGGTDVVCRKRLPNDSYAGRMLWVSRGHVGFVVASSRVRETSRPGTVGVYVPVAREEDFVPQLVFANVPAPSGRVRIHLRLFMLAEALPVDAAEVWVADRRVLVPFTATTAAGVQFGSADLSAAALSNADRVAVGVNAPFGKMIWGVLSVTDNVTQEVMVLAPHAERAADRWRVDQP